MMERHQYLSASGCQELLVLSPHCKKKKVSVRRKSARSVTSVGEGTFS